LNLVECRVQLVESRELRYNATVKVYESYTMVMKSMSVKFVRIAPRFMVNDLELALSFYKGLGFEVKRHDESLAFVKGGSFDFHVHYDPEAAPSHHVWWIEVKGVDALYQRCQESPSAKVCSTVKSQPWGFREFNIRDPFNNLLIFAERQD